jgi:hypothetical protein
MLEPDYLFLIVPQPAKAVDSLLICDFQGGIDAGNVHMRPLACITRTNRCIVSMQITLGDKDESDSQPDENKDGG